MKIKNTYCKSLKSIFASGFLLQLKCNCFVLFLFIIIPIITTAQSLEDSYFKGSANMENKKFELAIQNFTEVISLNNKKSDFYIQRGLCFYNLSDFTKAILDFSKADSLEKNSADYYLAQCFANTGNTEKGIYYLDQNLKSKNKVQQRFIKLDKAFISLHKTKEWKDLWKRDWFTNSENSMAEAEYLLSIKKYDNALNTIDEALAKQPKNQKSHAIRGKILSELNDYGTAEKELSTAINGKPYDADFYALRADVYFKSGKFKNAFEDIKQSIELNPLNLKYVYTKALIESKLELYENAVLDIQKYLHYYDFDNIAVYDCGLILYAKKDYFEALTYFNRLLEKTKNDAKLFVARGNTYLQCNTFNYAEFDFAQALDLNPNIAIAYFNRGIARFSQGNTQGACRDWKKASKLKLSDADDYLFKNCK